MQTEKYWFKYLSNGQSREEVLNVGPTEKNHKRHGEEIWIFFFFFKEKKWCLWKISQIINEEQMFSVKNDR